MVTDQPQSDIQTDQGNAEQPIDKDVDNQDQLDEEAREREMDEKFANSRAYQAIKDLTLVDKVRQRQLNSLLFSIKFKPTQLKYIASSLQSPCYSNHHRLTNLISPHPLVHPPIQSIRNPVHHRTNNHTQDIARLLSLASSSILLLALPQTDNADVADGSADLPKGEERSEQFVLEVSEYFQLLDVSRPVLLPLVLVSALAVVTCLRFFPLYSRMYARISLWFST